MAVEASYDIPSLRSIELYCGKERPAAPRTGVVRPSRRSGGVVRNGAPHRATPMGDTPMRAAPVRAAPARATPPGATWRVGGNDGGDQSGKRAHLQKAARPRPAASRGVYSGSTRGAGGAAPSSSTASPATRPASASFRGFLSRSGSSLKAYTNAVVAIGGRSSGVAADGVDTRRNSPLRLSGAAVMDTAPALALWPSSTGSSDRGSATFEAPRSPMAQPNSPSGGSSGSAGSDAGAPDSRRPSPREDRPPVDAESEPGRLPSMRSAAQRGTPPRSEVPAATRQATGASPAGSSPVPHSPLHHLPLYGVSLASRSAPHIATLPGARRSRRPASATYPVVRPSTAPAPDLAVAEGRRANQSAEVTSNGNAHRAHGRPASANATNATKLSRRAAPATPIRTLGPRDGGGPPRVSAAGAVVAAKGGVRHAGAATRLEGDSIRAEMPRPSPGTTSQRPKSVPAGGRRARRRRPRQDARQSARPTVVAASRDAGVCGVGAESEGSDAGQGDEADGGEAEAAMSDLGAQGHESDPEVSHGRERQRLQRGSAVAKQSKNADRVLLQQWQPRKILYESPEQRRRRRRRRWGAKRNKRAYHASIFLADIPAHKDVKRRSRFSATAMEHSATSAVLSFTGRDEGLLAALRGGAEKPTGKRAAAAKASVEADGVDFHLSELMGGFGSESWL